MSELSCYDYPKFYQEFDLPVTETDCGQRCASYNEGRKPFCCDTRHAVPTAYLSEWEFLQANTDLWHFWEAEECKETRRLNAQTPPGQVLIECKGHILCQRPYRSMTCRAFPFFPYISREKEFLGLSYYWDYEDRCWVISHLDQVTLAYRKSFIATYSRLFALQPSEFETFRHHSAMMRKIFGRKRRAIPLLHRNGKFYKISPHNGRMRAIHASQLGQYGPYKIVSKLSFPGEVP